MARKAWLCGILGFIVLLSLSVSCKNPEGTVQFINPPDKVVGSFALEDETGTILLEFPGSKAYSGKGASVKTVQDVTGSLTVSSDYVQIAGTYNDETGGVVADASGMIGTKWTTYHIDGTYKPGQGFTGTISRTRDSQTITGVVGGAEGDEGDLDIYVFTGTFSIKVTCNQTNLTDPDGPLPYPTNPYVVTIDPYGTFCVTSCPDYIVGIYKVNPAYDDDSGILQGLFTSTTGNEWKFTIGAGDVSGTGTMNTATWIVYGSFSDAWSEIIPWSVYQIRLDFEQEGTFTGTKAN
jgi:hypothetical protein